jgi:hypothetical protein
MDYQACFGALKKVSTAPTISPGMRNLLDKEFEN